MVLRRPVQPRRMRASHIACLIAGVVAGASCPMLSAAGSPGVHQPSDFEATIADVRKSDPNSPALLIAQLSYAEFLLNAAPGPCAPRLEKVQQLLGSVD